MKDEEQNTFENMASAEEFGDTTSESNYIGETEVPDGEVPMESVEMGGGEVATPGIGSRIILPQLGNIGQQAGGLAASALTRIGGAIGTPTPEYDDDLSDLFEGPSPYDADMYFDDLLDVSDADVFGDDDGDMSDILEVDMEDIMGGEVETPEEYEQRVRRAGGRPMIIQRRIPPTVITSPRFR